MPDPTWRSVSASQAPALLNQSPYATLFTLWWMFKGKSVETDFTQRMAWGKLLQEAILKATALQYRLEVIPNRNDEYTRNGQLGATIDGAMHDPVRGLVVVEAKNVDRLIWRDTWSP